MTHMPTTFDRPNLARSAVPLPVPVPAPIPAHNAQDLTGGGSVAHIRLDGLTYTLRITRQGKLILTK
jgi:hemin uptake protein HemP